MTTPTQSLEDDYLDLHSETEAGDDSDLEDMETSLWSFVNDSIKNNSGSLCCQANNCGSSIPNNRIYLNKKLEVILDPLEIIEELLSKDNDPPTFNELLKKRNLKGTKRLSRKVYEFAYTAGYANHIFAPVAGPYADSYVFLEPIASIPEELVMILFYIVEDYNTNTAFNMTVAEAKALVYRLHESIKDRPKENFNVTSNYLGSVGQSFKNALTMLIAVNDSAIIDFNITTWIKYIPKSPLRYKLLLDNLQLYLQAEKHKLLFYNELVHNIIYTKKRERDLLTKIERLAKSDKGSQLIGLLAYDYRIRPILEGFEKVYTPNPDNVYMIPLKLPPYCIPELITSCISTTN